MLFPEPDGLKLIDIIILVPGIIYLMDALYETFTRKD